MIEMKPKNVASLVRQVRGCYDETDAMQIAVDYVGGCTVNGVKVGFVIGVVVSAAIGAITLLVSVST